ncbi:MAG: hypothetical protein FWG12_02605 [Holophagaceae bacterium]|nr:hypothetical protein [Holophagaceae bacterium]
MKKFASEMLSLGGSALPPSRQSWAYIFPVAFALAYGVTFISCSSGKGSDGDIDSIANSVFVFGGDVYVAGQKHDPSQKKYVATIWKNGVSQYLDTTASGSSMATSVFVSQGDVYVAGIQALGNGPYMRGVVGLATIWKNGTPQQLLDHHRNAANSVFVDGVDVYVAGIFHDGKGSFSDIMKNGIPLYPITYSDSWYYDSIVGNSVYVANGDVYVAGAKFDPNQNMNSATVRKNGEIQFLGVENGDHHIASSTANSIFVSGENVYVVGNFNHISNHNYGALWINGTGHRITGSYSQEGNSIFVYGNDCYVAGEVRNPPTMSLGSSYATLWKNPEKPQYLDSYSEWARANSIFVSDNDVYVVGEEMGEEYTRSNEFRGRTSARLWKNGEMQELR